ncbi:MAG TPA: TetR/AcrR family transcriptional regulator [Woeseiaceae bacterium]|nr:TetR/AcrR family transcriptional regulator [Woeseiaceae bacterium]
MSRAPGYDRIEVLGRATEVFWDRGYGRTSMADIVAATGLQPGSLYAAFGSKKGMFLEVLDQYNDRFLLRLERLSKEPRPALDAIESLLLTTAEEALDDTDQRGCLAINALLEMSGHEPDIAEHLLSHHAEVESVVASLIEKAQDEGDISRSRESHTLSAFLLNNLWGMRVVCRQRPDRDTLHAIVNSVVMALRADP